MLCPLLNVYWAILIEIVSRTAGIVRKFSKSINCEPLKKNSLPNMRSMRTRRNSEIQKIFEYDVFLGGACNPTTWRKDVAIPFLDKAKITYYNPQVTTWSEDLVKKEQQAKSLSRILLFVFDPTKTRGLASLIEASYLAARGSLLVVVVPDLQQLGSLRVNGELLSKSEQKSLREGFKMLDQIVQNKANVFTDLQAALERVRYIIREERYPLLSRLSRHFTRDKSSPPPFSPRGELKEIIQSCDAESTFECYRPGSPTRWCCSMRTPILCSSEDKFDIYLGGCAAFCSTLRKDLVSYVKKLQHSYTVPNDHCIRISELNLAQGQCKALLYVISIASFGIAEQMEAAYAIGRGRKVVLLTESFSSRTKVVKALSRMRRSTSEYGSDDSTEGNPSRSSSGDFRASSDSGQGSFDSITSLGSTPPSDKEDSISISSSPRLPTLPTLSRETSNMSEDAINDHNRCRTYLVSLAEEMHCPVENSLKAALKLALCTKEGA